MRASPDSLVGTVLDGRYRVTSRIARGGMATVFLATDSRLDREVAIKVMHPHLADDPQFVARFHREAKSAARMSHPNVVAVFDQGQEGDVVYLVMEYVPGTTLRDLITDRGALTVGEALEVLQPLLDALSAAHRAGLVHRDVKPENVLITADGRVKVADFGLARAASTSHSSATTGMLMGTAAYLSPELVTRGVADARSDVYAAGIMTFEMLTGRQPFVGEVPIQVAFQHVNDEVPAPSSIDPGLPVAVDEIVTWSTARDPDLRPRDAAELAALARRVHDQLSDAELDRIPAGPPAALPAAARAGDPGATPTLQHATRVVAPDADDDGWDAPTPGPGRPSAATPTPTHSPTSTDLGARPSLTADGHQHAVQVGTDHDPEPAPRRRGIGVLIAVVVLALVLGGVGWFVTAGPGAYTTTPKVTGTAAQAKTTLTAHGLKMHQVNEYSETVDTGTVIRTDPTAGAKVHKNGTVDVVVSQGSAFTTATDIEGKSLDNARTLLEQAGLALGATTDEQYSDSVDKGAIISQNPEKGARVRRGDSVSVVVSKGREPVEVPTVTGQTQDEATAAITDVGLKPVPTEAYNDTVPNGTVISQDPSSGTLLRGDSVQIVVSQGPQPVSVPNVVNMSTADAVAALTAAGFQVNQQKILGGIFGTVRAQSPSGGTAPKGSTVTIQIV